MLRKLDKDLWVIDHALTITGGIRIGTRTTLIRLSDGNIFAHAPGPTDDGDHIEIDKLGNVTQIVASNLFHNMNVADWMSRYDASLFSVWGSDQVAILADYFETYGVPFHAWCVVPGCSPAGGGRRRGVGSRDAPSGH
ncbi:MAG: hypothetical protein IH973_14510 [Myxococcales bacterium]|nr:hypothetical protein [Myxococcales bacterium]